MGIGRDTFSSKFHKWAPLAIACLVHVYMKEYSVWVYIEEADSGERQLRSILPVNTLDKCLLGWSNTEKNVIYTQCLIEKRVSSNVCHLKNQTFLFVWNKKTIFITNIFDVCLLLCYISKQRLQLPDVIYSHPSNSDVLWTQGERITFWNWKLFFRGKKFHIMF